MASTGINELGKLLEQLSRDTWERLRDVQRLAPTAGLRFGEETITDLLMLDINRHPLTRAIFDPTSRPLETIQGTDFEWWLGSDKTGWFRFAVQAKKLNLKSGRYDNLKHKIHHTTQTERLEWYAQKTGAIPVYCLYNFDINADGAKHWHCCEKPFERKQLGCTIVPLSTIRKAQNTRGCRTFDFLHSDHQTIPWRCLAICPRIREKYTTRRLPLQAQARGQDASLFGVIPHLYPGLPKELLTESKDVEWSGSRRELDAKAMYDDAVYGDAIVRFLEKPRRILILATDREDIRRYYPPSES